MRQLTHENALAEALKDKEFKAIWEAEAVRREITKAIIGERIKQNLSQEELAAKAGLKQPSLARVEAGSVMPSLSTLTKIARALGGRLRVSFA